MRFARDAVNRLIDESLQGGELPRDACTHVNILSTQARLLTRLCSYVCFTINCRRSLMFLIVRRRGTSWCVCVCVCVCAWVIWEVRVYVCVRVWTFAVCVRVCVRMFCC